MKRRLQKGRLFVILMLMLLKAFIFFVLGLFMGSFVNALVWRLKKKRNWVSERSECTHCGHVLQPLDLIPVLSWVVLRGKCRYCKRKIEDTPLTELAVGVAFAVSYIFWPNGFDATGSVLFGFWLGALVLLAAMFLYDLRWMILPNKLTYALGALAAVQLPVAAVLSDEPAKLALHALIASLLGGVVFHALYVLSKGKYIGGGDVKLGYAYGLLLLNPLLPWVALTIASLLGSVVAVALMLLGKAGMKSKLPFGPLLIAGVVIAQLFGERLWDFIGRLWY